MEPKVFKMPDGKGGTIYQILTPDDRQPGWRTRSYSSKYDIATGMMQQLTYGYRNSRIGDISPDGKFALQAHDPLRRRRCRFMVRGVFDSHRIDPSNDCGW